MPKINLLEAIKEVENNIEGFTDQQLVKLKGKCMVEIIHRCFTTNSNDPNSKQSGSTGQTDKEVSR